MLAAVYKGKNNIVVEEVPKPEINENEMLLKVKACNICGTDLKILKHGYHKISEGEERILGHEVTGEIVETGANIRNFKPGDRVATAPNIGCGYCDLCAGGYNNLCDDYEAFGVSLDGGFAEYMKITSEAITGGNVVKIPDNLSYLEASINEPFSCVYNAYEFVNITPEDSVLIIGAGPIGLLHLSMARIAGAKKVIVSDVSKERLEISKDYGADVALNPAEVDLKKNVFEQTGGKGADVIITACSVPAVQEQALELAAKLGRISFFGGLPQGKDEISFKSNLVHYKQLTVNATTGSTISQFRKTMDLLKDKKFDIRGLISHTFSLQKIEEAFELAESGEGLKISVTP